MGQIEVDGTLPIRHHSLVVCFGKPGSERIALFAERGKGVGDGGISCSAWRLLALNIDLTYPRARCHPQVSQMEVGRIIDWHCPDALTLRWVLGSKDSS